MYDRTERGIIKEERIMTEEYTQQCAKLFARSYCRIINDPNLTNEQRAEFYNKINHYIDYRTKFGKYVKKERDGNGKVNK